MLSIILTCVFWFLVGLFIGAILNDLIKEKRTSQKSDKNVHLLLSIVSALISLTVIAGIIFLDEKSYLSNPASLIIWIWSSIVQTVIYTSLILKEKSGVRVTH
jgi:hypothetical protein